MARFLENTDFVQACREENRKIDLKVWIDWFGDGQLDELTSADDEVLKLDLSRELEGDVGQAILDQGTLVLDNSNNDYSPKSLASRFNVDLGGSYEFNLIPNRNVMIDLSVNGSDYAHYYSGVITNIEPNYDNSKVSITIEDEMLALDNYSAPDHLFIEQNAKDVIQFLLETTTIDYDPTLIDDIDYQITYNFYEEGSVFNALNLIAEMVWGKFFVIEDKLRFINFKEFEQPNQEIAETITDRQFMDSGYGEIFSSQDLYTTVELDSNPLQYTSEELQMIWTGSEKQSRVTEEYLGSDIAGEQLQLTHTVDNVVEEPTNNVPIATNSLTVSFGDRTYVTNYGMTSGIESVDWDTGLITFKNTAEFPLPSSNQTVTVNYNFFVLTIPPRKSDGTPYEKEIIAEFENPSTDVQDIEDYIKFEATNLDYEVTYASYRDYISGLKRGSAGTYQSGSITLSDNASTIQLSGRLRVKNADYKWSWGRGTDKKNATAEVYVVQNGSRVKSIKRYTTGWNTTSYSSGKIPVNPGDEINLEVVFDGTGEKYSEVQLYTVTANVGETIVDEVTEEVHNVRVEQYDFPDKRKTRLTFINDSDTEVSVYSEYQGKDIDNIYLLGKPLKRTNPKHVEKTNEDANSSFAYMGKTLSIQNDLYQNQTRMMETVDFLLDYYSTPRSVLNIEIKGLGHIDLMDKVAIDRAEADIDNDFFIKTIEESFTEEGEWVQNLELFQADSSTWEYKSEGINSIVTDNESTDVTPNDRPPSVGNLNVTVTTLDEEGDSFPALDINYTGSRHARIYTIYLKRGSGGFEEITRTTDESYKYSRPLKSGNYTVKVVSENYDGISEEFSTAPEFDFSYGGSEQIDSGGVSLTEIKSIGNDGTIQSYVLAEWIAPNDNIYGYTSVYRRNIDEGTDFKLLTRTNRDYYETDFMTEGTYEFKFVAEDRYGESSDFVTAPTEVIIVEGQTAPPNNVSIKNTSFEKQILIEWYSNVDADLDGYEVRSDENFGNDDSGLLYKGKGNRLTINEFPVQGFAEGTRDFTFYIKAFNTSGIYSQLSEEINITKDAPSPPTVNIDPFFEKLWIELTPPMDKSIVGFNVEIIDTETNNVETFDVGFGERVTYNAKSQTEYDVRVRSYDVIGGGSWSSTYTTATQSLNDIAQFAKSMQPPELVDDLPTLPNSSYPVYSLVVLKSDKKLYKNVGDSWTTNFDMDALNVFQNIVAATVIAGAVGTDELAANSITADKVGSNEIITELANIDQAVIDQLTVDSIEAGDITVGSATTFEDGYNPYKNSEKAIKVMPEGSKLWHFDKHLTSTQGELITIL